jgi:[ribosomal protein S18]-alanine N-acetyltransferase
MEKARVKIRALLADDVERVMEIQGMCHEIAQWTMWDYDRVARGEMAGWVAENAPEKATTGAAGADGNVAGFLVARRIANDLEILNFAVAPELRRRGIGAALLEAALAWGRSFQAEAALLEVRASNFAALAFYERNHFQIVGKRPNYYAAPVEDALLLIAGFKRSVVRTDTRR